MRIQKLIMDDDIKIGVDELGRIGYFYKNEWHWLSIDRTSVLIDKSKERIDFGDPLHMRKCNSCGGGIMQRTIIVKYPRPQRLLTFKYACSCIKNNPEVESLSALSYFEDDWIPVQKIDSDIIIG